MAVDYPNTFPQFGAELRLTRKIQAIWEHSHFANNANFSKRLIKAEYDETINEEEIAETFAANFLEATLQNNFRSLHSAQLVAMETSFFTALDAEISLTATDLAAGAISYTYNILTNGTVSIARRNGRYGVLRANMVADVETILQNNLVFGALVADVLNPGPAGSIVMAVPTGEDHTLGGTFVLEVTDDTVSRPQLTVNLDLTTELIDGITVIVADNNVTVDQTYQDGQTGLSSLALTRPGLTAPTESGDDGAMFSAHTIVSPTETDSAKGRIFIKVTRLDGTTADFQVDWFSDGGLTTRIV